MLKLKHNIVAYSPSDERGHSGNTTPDEVNGILSLKNHPKYSIVQSWATTPIRRKWYEKNKERLFSVSDSLVVGNYEIALSILEGEHSYREGLNKLGNTSHTDYPNWWNIFSELPGGSLDHISFVKEVIGIPLVSLPLDLFSDSGSITTGRFWSRFSNDTIGTSIFITKNTIFKQGVSHQLVDYTCPIIGARIINTSEQKYLAEIQQGLSTYAS